MALKDIWTNKTDDVDDILADDINAIANEVISNAENKADKSDIPTKVSQLENDTNYVSNTDYATADVGGVVKVVTSGNAYGIVKNSNNIIQISCAEKSDIKLKGSYTKPITPINLNYAVEVCTNQTMSDDNTEVQSQLPASYNAVKGYVDEKIQATHTWQLIGKATLEEDSQNIVVDLPAPIAEWYNETLMLVEIPKSESLNGSTNGDVAIIARKGTTRTCFIITVNSTSATYGALDPAWVNRWAVITQWSDKKPLCTTVNRSRASAQAYSLASISAATFSYKDTVDGATNFVFRANQDFVFPTGSTFEIYGRY